MDRQQTTPFLLKLFYKAHDFHRLEEFAPDRQPSSHLQIYTWSNCSLRELSALLTSTVPSLFEPVPAGHRIAFRLIFPDMRTPPRSPEAPGRYTAKDMGSVIVGSSQSLDGYENGVTNGNNDDPPQDDDSAQTLSDSKFVVGDFVSCVILPPQPNGEVAPPPPPSGAGRGGYGGPPPRSFGGGGGPPRENGYYGRGGRAGRGGSFDGGFGGREALPTGEWRRGERVPDGQRSYGRGRGRW